MALTKDSKVITEIEKQITEHCILIKHYARCIEKLSQSCDALLKLKNELIKGNIDLDTGSGHNKIVKDVINEH